MPWNIVGHERAVRAFQRALATGTLAQAYILMGPPRIGKRTLALELAKALDCQAAEAGSRPCGQCHSCHAINAGQHPDVATFSRASPLVPGEEPDKDLPRRFISIEQVRELQRTASLAPFAGRIRVYIIDGADEMNAESANCLLKTLEEPPDKVRLLLLCSNAIVMLPTVLSRCQRLDMGPLPVPTVTAALSQHWGAPAEQAARLAEASEGRLGWAVEALRNPDRLEQRERLQERLVETMAGSRTQRLAYAGEIAALWSRDQAAGGEVLEAWRRLFRGLLHARAGGESSSRGTLPLPAQQLQGLSVPALVAALRALASAAEQLRANVSARLVFDVLFLGLPAVAGLSPAAGPGGPPAQARIERTRP